MWQLQFVYNLEHGIIQAISLQFCIPNQHAKKVVSNNPGLLDFAIGLVNSVINLPDGQVKFFEEFKLQKNCEVNLLIKTFLGLAEMMFGLLNVQLARISSCKNDFLCTLLIISFFLYFFSHFFSHFHK